VDFNVTVQLLIRYSDITRLEYSVTVHQEAMDFQECLPIWLQGKFCTTFSL